jgi:hypothetical protein
MLKVENIEVIGLEGAIRGMRNPMDSWKHIDSEYDKENPRQYNVGEKDLGLMKRLCKAGTEHAKFMRMIHIQFDLTTNAIVWAEFDTYKVGVTRNSCSKMHRIHVKPFTEDMFSTEGIGEVGYAKEELSRVLGTLNKLREDFNKTKEKRYWRAMLELLPHGYNMKATIDMNYQNAQNIIKQRRNHKMQEWNVLCDELLKLPYMSELIGQKEG